MHTQTTTMKRWFMWFGWFTDKVEARLESQAVNGWHLVKANRNVIRFHFVKGTPKSVRFCADYPAKFDDEYATLVQDAGWTLADSAAGWYIWQVEYTGSNRPEAFNDVEPLLERNGRMLIVFGAVLLTQIPIIASHITGDWLESASVWVTRTVNMVHAFAVIIMLIACGATLYQRKQLLAGCESKHQLKE